MRPLAPAPPSTVCRRSTSPSTICTRKAWSVMKPPWRTPAIRTTSSSKCRVFIQPQTLRVSKWSKPDLAPEELSSSSFQSTTKRYPRRRCHQQRLLNFCRCAPPRLRFWSTLPQSALVTAQLGACPASPLSDCHFERSEKSAPADFGHHSRMSDSLRAADSPAFPITAISAMRLRQARSPGWPRFFARQGGSPMLACWGEMSAISAILFPCHPDRLGADPEPPRRGGNQEWKDPDDVSSTRPHQGVLSTLCGPLPIP